MLSVSHKYLDKFLSYKYFLPLEHHLIPWLLYFSLVIAVVLVLTLSLYLQLS